MMSRRILIPLVLAALMVPFALAQENPGQGGDQNRRGGGPGGGNFDPAAMRQRALDRVKEDMGDLKDDEWKVIEAKLTPVMEKRFEVAAAGMGGFRAFGRGGRGGDSNQPERPARNAIEQTSRDLDKVLKDKSASEDQVKEKLTAFREARDKARAELASAQKDLKEVLMPRQEAVLVSSGYLD